MITDLLQTSSKRLGLGSQLGSDVRGVLGREAERRAVVRVVTSQCAFVLRFRCVVVLNGSPP